MTIDEQMLTLGKLSRTDMRLRELETILTAGPRELKENRRAVEEAKAALATAVEQRAEADAGRLEAETELVASERRLLQSQENAKRIATETQLDASRVEIGALQVRRDEWEDAVLAQMARAEELDKEIPRLKKALKVARSATRKVEASVPKLVDSAKQEAVALLRDRDEHMVTLDAVARRLYQTAVSRPGNPMTSVLDKICQTCHTRVPPQYLVETLQSKAIHICPTCKKIVGKVMHSED